MQNILFLKIVQYFVFENIPKGYFQKQNILQGPKTTKKIYWTKIKTRYIWRD